MNKITETTIEADPTLPVIRILTASPAYELSR